MRRSLIGVLLVLGLTGCGAVASTQTSTAPPQPAASTTATTSHHAVARRRRAPAHRSRPHPASKPATAPGGLVVSAASAHQVQPQPAPGSCHAIGHGEIVKPDPRCTPGATSPAVTQATINQTICVPGYTKTVRPSESVTEPEKLASMAAYGYQGRSPGDFEYDHLISLELGGAVNDPRNLWPESGGSPNPKDTVENALHRMVCDGQMPLARAQHIIATDWRGWAQSNGMNTSGPPASSSSRPASSASPPASSAPAPPSRSATPGGPNKPVSEVNCSDFDTHGAAQQWFTAHGGSAGNDVAGLDANHDGIACSSLP